MARKPELGGLSGDSPPYAPDLNQMTVMRFGYCDTDYARNRIMARVLRRAGARVVDLIDSRSFAKRTPHLLRGSVGKKADILLVGFPGHLDVVTARGLGFTTGARVVFDPLIGLHETNVDDRQRVGPRSLQARRYAIEDMLSCRFADLVLLDTDAHISYFAELTRTNLGKFKRVWLGTDDEVMFPRDVAGAPETDVFFYGNVTPMHGAEHILAAAKLLESRNTPVRMTMVGSGPHFESVRREAGLKNIRSVTFLPEVSYDRLAQMMARSRICLGIFGTTGKAQRVIPNKVFDTLAVGRPLITGDTPAAREALVHRTNAWLCPPGDPEGLAEAISVVLADEGLQQSLSTEGHRLFEREFSTEALTRTIAGAFGDLLSGRH